MVCTAATVHTFREERPPMGHGGERQDWEARMTVVFGPSALEVTTLMGLSRALLGECMIEQQAYHLASRSHPPVQTSL